MSSHGRGGGGGDGGDDGGGGSHAVKLLRASVPRSFSLLSARFYSRLFLRLALCIRTRYDYVDEDTSWHFAIGTLRSRDSATRCPCALNKCENTACAVQCVADTARRSSYAYFERGEFLTPTLTRPRSTSLSFLPRSESVAHSPSLVDAV